MVTILGAKKQTNNTGEMSAVLECMLHLLGQTNAPESLLQTESVIHAHTDSKYVIGTVEHKSGPKENVAMSLLLSHLLKLVCTHLDNHINKNKAIQLSITMLYVDTA